MKDEATLRIVLEKPPARVSGHAQTNHDATHARCSLPFQSRRAEAVNTVVAAT
jgi:hypothetical protein